jgi:predicted Fe-Mo cluster-binding NifX family protein
MKFALPVSAKGRLAPHFGHSDQILFVTVDGQGTATAEQLMPLPPHEPGLYPRLIIERQPDVLLAGGIGERAVLMLADAGIRVVAGLPDGDARQLVRDWIAGTVEPHTNPCQGRAHDDEHACEHEPPEVAS